MIRIWQWSSNAYYWILQNLHNMTTCPHCQIGRCDRTIVAAIVNDNRWKERMLLLLVEKNRIGGPILESLLLERISLKSYGRKH